MKNFFIIGAPKTGTTLLARLIDSHPDIACTTELFPFHMKGGKRVINPNWREKQKDHDLTVDLNVGNLGDNEFARIVMQEILNRFGDKCNASIVGDKFPWYIGFIDDMLEMFPDAHYIYNVRDPRAVWNSAKQFTRPGRADSLLRMMLNYDKKIDLYLYEKKFYTFKFEDLIQNKDSIMGNLFRFIGACPFRGGSSEIKYPARFKGIPNSTESLDPSICTKWKTQMTTKEIKHVTNMSIDFIKKYGYGE